MKIVEKAISLPERLRASIRTRRTAAILESLPEEIRKDIGWNSSFQSRNW